MISRPFGIDLLFYKDVVDDLVLEESSEILKENARMKAKSCAEQTGYLSLGDDSGIFVRALDYFPGVHSRRWSGTEGDDTSRNKKIISLMENEKDRLVYLISRFALVSPDGTLIGEYVIKNPFDVANCVKGEHGFGYDPILCPRDEAIIKAILNGKIPCERGKEIIANRYSIGELTQEEKNAINNRGAIAEEVLGSLNGYKNIN